MIGQTTKNIPAEEAVSPNFFVSCTPQKITHSLLIKPAHAQMPRDGGMMRQLEESNSGAYILDP